MPELDLRPGRVDLYCYAGNDHTVTVDFGVSLAGRTFTVRLNRRSGSPVAAGAVVAGNTVVVTIADTVDATAQWSGWEFVETTAGEDQVLIGGYLTFGTTAGTSSSTSTSVSLSSGTVAVSTALVNLTPAPVLVPWNDGSQRLLVGETGVWKEVDNTGTPAARTYDVVIPNVSAGQSVGIEPNGYVTSASGGLQFDYWTVVGGVKVAQFQPPSGPTGWIVDSNTIGHILGSKSKVVGANEIEAGGVRLRAYFQCSTGVTRTLLTGLVNYPFSQEGRGPFG